jgi:polygalacturonase
MYYNILDFGAVAEPEFDNSLIIQRGIDQCHQHGGGVVICPAGVFGTGSLFLKSNVELHLAQGCTLRGSSRREAYRSSLAPYDTGSAAESVSGTHLVSAWRQSRCAITGPGCLDGNSPAFFATESGTAWRWDFRPERWRPGQMVAFLECDHVRMENVTLINSPYWTVWPYACRKVVLRGVQIINDWKTPNGDGIDPDCCEDVVIADCDIQAGDDAIALRANEARGGPRHALDTVAISNCIISTRFGGIRLGPSGEQSVLRNVVVSNCIIKEATKGILFSQWHHPPRWDCGVLIENILFSNIIINAYSPFRLYARGECRSPAGFRNICLENISATGQETSNFLNNGLAIAEDIRLRHVRLTMVKPPSAENHPGFLPPFCRGHAFYFQHLQRLQLTDIQIESTPEDGLAFSPAVVLDHVNHARIRQLAGEFSNIPQLLNCQDCQEVMVET